MKTILSHYSAPAGHWVGDGFPVKSLLSYGRMREDVSPFLLLDHAGPHHFAPATTPRGVGQHPHRGFATVTIVYEGEVQHRDSTGAGGSIGPGDVQWMTAASGIIHEEFHSEEFTRRGGDFHVVQLWVNLPARAKMSAPGYQTLLAGAIPQLELAGGKGRLRVIAGACDGVAGPAHSFTPVNVWDVQLQAGASATLPLPDGHNSLLAVLGGKVRVNGAGATVGEIVLLSPEGAGVNVEAADDALLLALSGEPIAEPIAGYGPFVMNSEAEIRAAITDFNTGRFLQATAA